MCDNMEDSGDVFARRKLEFRSMPFKTKSFYVDVKSKSVRQRVEGYICNLGGSIETFLSNDIHVFVSDSRPVTKRPSRLRGETTLQHGDSTSTSSKNNQALPLSRGRALLMKARKNTSDNLTSEVNSVTNIQDKATEMGITIEHVHSFLKRCKELGATHKQVTKTESLGDMVPIKWEDKCFIKVEDDSCHYKPLHKKLENLPLLYPDNGGGSPFDGPVVLVRPTTGSTVRKEKKVSRFSQTKGGYCEMCQAWYKDTLKQHAKSSGHQKFVRNKENFAELDKIVRKLPNLNKFLFKYIPTRNVDSVPCYKSDATPVTSPDVQLPGKNVYDFDTLTENNVSNNGISTDIANILSGDGKLPNLSLSSLETTNLINDISAELNIDTTSVDVTTTQTTVDEKRCQSQEPVFDWNNCDMLSGILDHQVTGSKMFSEPSDVESQTNVLKNLIDSLTLQNETAKSESADVPSPMIVNTPEVLTPQSMAPNQTRVEHVTGTTNQVLELPGDTPMSTASPVCVPVVSITLPSPEQLKLGFKPSVEQSPSQNPVKTKRRKRDKNKCIYLSQKTSDTKLKLCKIVETPVAQKSNLKMFWKVRKTGECRLLFSSEKRKRSVPDENSHRTGDEMLSPLRANDIAPKPKRQRLVF